MVTGRVITHAINIFLTVFFWRFFFPLPTIIVPATPEESTWVVLTGNPKDDERLIVAAATSSALAPCAYVRCVFPIFSPIVTTILFQPTMVPKPRARETIRITHRGAYSV